MHHHQCLKHLALTSKALREVVHAGVTTLKITGALGADTKGCVSKLMLDGSWPQLSLIIFQMQIDCFYTTQDMLSAFCFQWQILACMEFVNTQPFSFRGNYAYLALLIKPSTSMLDDADAMFSLKSVQQLFRQDWTNCCKLKLSHVKSAEAASAILTKLSSIEWPSLHIPKLSLSSYNFDSQAMQQLARGRCWPYLTTLTLTHALLSVEAISELNAANWPMLRNLCFVIVPFSAAVMKQLLQACPATLFDLTFQYCKISTGALMELERADRPNLKHLHLHLQCNLYLDQV